MIYSPYSELVRAIQLRLKRLVRHCQGLSSWGALAFYSLYCGIIFIMSGENGRDSASLLLRNADIDDKESPPQSREGLLHPSLSSRGWNSSLSSHRSFLGVGYGVLCFLYLGLFCVWIVSRHYATSVCPNTHDLFPCELQNKPSFEQADCGAA